MTGKALRTLLADANALLRAGQLAQAEHLYRQIILQQPGMATHVEANLRIITTRLNRQERNKNAQNALVSIIMPCHNDGEYIQESIASALGQTYRHIELIIIDDGSDDECSIRALGEINNPKVKIIRYATNMGPSYARNQGIKVARGKYILCLDADDLIHSSYIQKCLREIERDSEIGIVYCLAEYFGEKRGRLPLPSFSMEEMKNRNLIFVAALFKRADWENVGGFDESLIRGLEDYDFWLSILGLGRKVYQIPEVLFRYRKKAVSRNQKILADKTVHTSVKSYIHAKHAQFLEQKTVDRVDFPKRKKFFVCMYLAHNFGDDLFLLTLASRYPECEFTINYSKDDYDHFVSRLENVSRVEGRVDYNRVGARYDGLIYIGGSLFQEKGDWLGQYKNRAIIIDQFTKRSKPVFILGANFGEYSSQEFYDQYAQLFHSVHDVCFRDRVSHRLFRHMRHVRYSSDVAFMYPGYQSYRAYRSSHERTIGFSLIDLRQRSRISQYHQSYIKYISQAIQKYVSMGWRCCLVSLCEIENDLIAVNEVLSLLPEACLGCVSVYEYKDNMDEALGMIATFDLFVATRLHASIVGLCLGVPIISIIYDRKTFNILDDLLMSNVSIGLDEMDKLLDDDFIGLASENTVESISNVTINNVFSSLEKYCRASNPESSSDPYGRLMVAPEQNPSLYSSSPGRSVACEGGEIDADMSKVYLAGKAPESLPVLSGKFVEHVKSSLKCAGDLGVFDKLLSKFDDGKAVIGALGFFLKMKGIRIPRELEFWLKTEERKRCRGSIGKEKRSGLVSVVIPLYNGEDFIERTILSVLSQSYSDVEVIVIDDCSTDASPHVLQKGFGGEGKIKYYRNDVNVDVGESRRRGYNLSNGQYVVFVDQDDFYVDRHFFSAAVAVLSSDSDASFVAADTLIYNQKTGRVSIHELGLPAKVDRESYFLNLQSDGFKKPTSTFPTIYKKEVLEKSKIHEVEFLGDSTIYQRALLVGQPVILDRVVGVYSVHENNSTKAVEADFVINTLNSHISTSNLAIEEYKFDSRLMRDWMSKKAEISCSWFLNAGNVSKASARQLISYLDSQSIVISKETRGRLECVGGA